MPQLVPIVDIDPAAVELLLDRAFGAERHGRTAYRIRAGMTAIPALSFAALDGGVLVGTIQCWPIRFVGDDGVDVPMVQLGPVAVEPARQQSGIGRALTARALAAAAAQGLADAMTLIGDPEYYGRFFGFDANRTAAWRVPGPVERHRLLARGASVPAGAGVLRPRSAALARLYAKRGLAYREAMPMDPIPDLATLSLADIARLAEARKLPPVERWNPTHCGDSEMRISRDGTWFHQGSPIRRLAMVRLFSTILRREPDGGYVLVTPVEKLDIAVEDAPFVAVELKAAGAGREATLTFRLNTGDLVTADAGHPLRFEPRADGPRPYLRVRGALDAVVARAVYYELAQRAIDGEDVPPGVWSAGAFFPIEPAPIEPGA